MRVGVRLKIRSLYDIFSKYTEKKDLPLKDEELAVIEMMERRYQLNMGIMMHIFQTCLTLKALNR